MRVLLRRQGCVLPSRIREAAERVKACVKESNSLSGCPFETVDEIMRGAGASLLGIGLYRYGYAYGRDCMVKLAKAEVDKGDNVKESGTYNSLRPEARDLFARVGETDPEGYWEAMDRADLTGLTFQEKKAIRDDLVAKLRGLGYYCGDLHLGNVGRVGDRGVITNYGYEVHECPIPTSG